MRRRNRLSGWDERIIDGFLGLLSRITEDSSKSRDPRVKFVGYHELLKLLGESGCPVCTIIHRSLLHYLNVVFIEQLTAPEFREPLQDSLGYCPKHSTLVRLAAKKKLPRMGIAVVYEDLLEQVEMRLEKHEGIPIPSTCPLCGIEKNLEEYAVQLIADYCGDEELQQHYLVSDGACLPHLRMMIAKLESEPRKFLFSAEKQILDRLTGNLQEFMRKQDHRYSKDAMTDAEASSWKQAVHFLVGE